MILKKTLISAIFAVFSLGICPAIQAQEIRTLEDYLDRCIPQEGDAVPVECDTLDRNTELDVIKQDEENKRKRSRRREVEKEEKSGGIGGYAGTTLGIFFPDIDRSRPIFRGNDVDIDNGFGGSIFAGIKFNRYLGTDLEFNTIVGEIDSDLDEDESYTLFSVSLNPRFILPLTGKKNSVSLYLSPGIGISQLFSTVEDEIDDFDRITTIEDRTRFTWQIKSGVSIPVSRKFSILVQGRYTSQTGDDAIDYFGSELGVNFDF